MPAMMASAPGKIILFGEHAVVYGRPAIAIPVQQVKAQVIAAADPTGSPGEAWIDAPQISLHARASQLPPTHPLRLAVESVSETLGIDRLPAVRLRVNSSIPIAGGMGSGAAVAVALIRAFSEFLGRPLPNETVNALAYRVEQRLHGSPSGIDNTVITYACPIYYQRERGFQPLRVGQKLTFVIADTGVRSPTAQAVGEVRRRFEREPSLYEDWFDQIAAITNEARAAIETGSAGRLGPLMNENHALLVSIGVSSPDLERLTAAAREAGATGAKLSGAGMGGNLIALVDAGQSQAAAAALRAAGAARTIITYLGVTQ